MYIPDLDGYRIHTNIPALICSQVEETLKKPLGNKYLDNPVTLGEKIRNRRLELRLFQKEVAGILGVTEDTVTNWEMNKHVPGVENYPAVIKFLGYFPFEIDTSTLAGRTKRYRYLTGLSQEGLAHVLGLNESTIYHLEKGTHTPFKKTMQKLEFLFGQMDK